MQTTDGPGPDQEEEQFEHIPWSRLERVDQKRRFYLYLTAAALVAGGLSASMTRSLSAPPVGEAPAVPTTPTPPPDVTTTIPSTTAPPPLSEADLMALHAEDRSAAAAVQAEWFVADYFTIDGSEETGQRLSSVLPAGVPAPDQQGGRSFVEWVRTVEVEQISPHRFRALVVVRTLSAPGDQPYQRMPSRAVEIVIEINDEGTMVVDLPSPAELPAIVVGEPFVEDAVPDRIAAAARRTAGDDAEVLSAGPVGDGFRVVVAVPDAAGLSWPLVLWLDGNGQPVTTGSLDPGF